MVASLWCSESTNPHFAPEIPSHQACACISSSTDGVLPILHQCMPIRWALLGAYPPKKVELSCSIGYSTDFPAMSVLECCDTWTPNMDQNGHPPAEEGGSFLAWFCLGDSHLSGHLPQPPRPRVSITKITPELAFLFEHQSKSLVSAFTPSGWPLLDQGVTVQYSGKHISSYRAGLKQV